MQILDCIGCGRVHHGDKPDDWDTLAFELDAVEKAAVGGSRTTQRMVVFFFCFCCEAIRQRMIRGLKETKSSRPTRQ